MIHKYIFGQPIHTGSVVAKIEASTQHFSLMAFTLTDQQLMLTCTMDRNDIVYGLGEQMRGINKRGFTYISYAADDATHTENKHSLYGSHNFMILYGRSTFGIFVDDPGKVVFDIGEAQIDTLTITANANCIVYTIEGNDLKDIVKQFRKLIGRSYIPPKWAFGYMQSRFGYKSTDDIRKVISWHHDRQIPLESVCLDIDYMENHKDFTVDAVKFPDFSTFVAEVKKQNIHLIPIIDAGIKIEKGYFLYEEGVNNNYFCKDADNNDFIGAVWPGKVHFPDMLNKNARTWFGEKYLLLMEQGIDGFWNDMNEPAIFYSEKRIKEAFDSIRSLPEQSLNSYFQLNGIVFGLSNSPEDYQNIYHNMSGKSICHDRVHNLYGYYMTMAASEAFDRIAPNQRILLFSRSSCIGMHRYGGIWTGDNYSWWGHLLLSIWQMPSLNMCGFLYTGSDIGGFRGDTTEDLLMRWLEFGIFTPLMRNHSDSGTRMQEVCHFTHIDSFRNIIRLRYCLIPYIYSEFMKAALDDEMYFRPLAFDYPEDTQALRIEDQLMVGESIMIAPVYMQNAVGRYVYLPEKMMLVRMKSPKNFVCEVMEKGHYYVDVALDEVIIFIKNHHILPLALIDDNLKTTDDLKKDQYEWLGFTDEQVSYELYNDDGISKIQPDIRY